ncbi:hypothetical protein A1O1_00392 [Capronia coronata CBS 617.96]|uniref:Dynactin subunit 6 n=1 Tax=Capronia coronata CBS 617.96 TaxID=1182541 RepID=W9YQT5_9EURO|nr:uncharacterized protein A1O1_00392 [Capronia coronata CBS 617.96]EXJ95272.1 hypothetical protein A1O1_00392 [Capronia coronata CBS 617.96]
MSSQPASVAPQTTASTTSSSSSARPPVTLGQTTHLDPGAYVRGSHGITIGEQTLIHPRAQLIATHGPLSIGDRCIISEKSIIGGPLESPSTLPPASGSGSSLLPAPQKPVDQDNDESDPMKTTIYPNVYIHAYSRVHAGATIKEAAVVEAHVTIFAGVTVGSHAKICAGVTVDQDVDDWTVVYGNGDVKRQRTNGQSPDVGAQHMEVVEAMRLKAMDKEREGTVAILKMAARMATLAKKK